MPGRALIGAGLLALAVLAGCSSDDQSSAADGTTTTSSADQRAAAAGELVGSWHRAQTCEEMLAAFQRAGLEESHREWLQGNFFGGEPGPATGDPCAGAQGPLEHDHVFTASGEFGSHDQDGEEVDDGDFEAIDDDTVAFPSHAAEFGYDGELAVDYVIDGDLVTFDVMVPDECIDSCADAYAWAVSAFGSGPWERGQTP